jgi:hypothetical protein
MAGRHFFAFSPISTKWHVVAGGSSIGLLGIS